MQTSAADLANDPIEAAEKTVVLPVPPNFLQEQSRRRAFRRGTTPLRPCSEHWRNSQRASGRSQQRVPSRIRVGGTRRDRRRDRFDEDADAERVLDTHGRILRDNVYGNIDDDVWRRDFTANSLYYNIADFSLWDYVGGAEDIAARRLKLIGDPGDALPRRSGAHAARRAFRSEAELQHRRADRHSDQGAARIARSTCRRRDCSTKR